MCEQHTLDSCVIAYTHASPYSWLAEPAACTAAMAVLSAGHPVVLCTDDQGVFQTSLSKEYAIAVHAFNLSEDDLWTLAMSSVQTAFLSADRKAELTALMQKQREGAVEPV